MRVERKLIEYANIPERKRELETKIKQTSMSIENIRNTLKSSTIDDMPKNNSDISDQVYRAVEKIVDEFKADMEYYQQQLKRINEDGQAMYQALKHLTPEQYQIIDYRYIKGYRWEYIARKIPLHRTNCIKKKNKAIEVLEENYKE